MVDVDERYREIMARLAASRDIPNDYKRVDEMLGCLYEMTELTMIAEGQRRAQVPAKRKMFRKLG